MNLINLRYFVEVCREGNFTHTAEKIHVTQPTLTRAIKELEREFQVALVYRENNRIKPTLPGLKLMEMAVHVLSDIDQIKQVMKEYSSQNFVMNLGVTFMTNATFFPELFQLIHQKFPATVIQVTPNLTSELFTKLETRQLHMLMVPYPPEDHQFPYFHWRKRRFLFCVSTSHPLATRKEICFQDICKEPLISYFGDRYLMKLGLEEKFKEAGGKLNILHRCDQILVMQALIKRGVGGGFMLEGSFPVNQGIIGLPLKEELQTDVYIVWNRQFENIHIIKEILQYLKKYSE